MSKELLHEYNVFSLTIALMPFGVTEVEELNHIPTASPLASHVSASAESKSTAKNTQWAKMIAGMTKERQAEVISKAIQQVQESNYRGLRKGALVAELRQGLKDELPISDSAKFFMMRAAFNCDYKFMFRSDCWHFPRVHPTVLIPADKWTVLKPDGSIALETPKLGDSVGVESPWHPLKARGAYKKPELMEMVQVLVGDVSPKTKADELYAMLVGKLHPLGQP